MKQTDADNRKKWLNITEACAYLEISEQTMFRWMREGKITYYKVGKSTRFKEEDLDKTIEKVAGRDESAPPGELRCAVCESTDLIRGRLSALGEVIFKPEKSRFSVWTDSTVKLTAYCCSNCGHIQLQADTGQQDDGGTDSQA